MKKGVSLILLVITIIIISILASTVIFNLVNNNIILKVEEAKFKTNLESYRSELVLTFSNKYFKDFSFDPSDVDANIWNGESSTNGTIKEYIPSIKMEDAVKFNISKGKLKYVGDNENELKWSNDLLNNSLLVIEDLVTFKIKVNDFATENSTITGKDYSYDNPVIPVGFKAINTDNSNWDDIANTLNKGLVIEDKNANQFVWIPVDQENITYSKKFDYDSDCDATKLNTEDADLPIGVTNEVDQIEKYGGFYIARYESGNESGVVVSKKNALIWNFINHYNALSVSQQMYNSEQVKSGLITGTAWDTTMKWLEYSNIDVFDSRSWGNYTDSIDFADVTGHHAIQNSGYCDFWRANNIYDLGGNLWEWTSEICNGRGIRRGGYYYSLGSRCPASFRDDDNLSVKNIGVAFRVMLYIM